MNYPRVTYQTESSVGRLTLTGYRVSPHFAALRDDRGWTLDHLPTGYTMPRELCLVPTLRQAATLARRLERLRSWGLVWRQIPPGRARARLERQMRRLHAEVLG